jgi:protein-L-isoaspartate(D-aspartate) O-methyltransferase
MLSCNSKQDMQDTFRHKGLRNKLIEIIKEKGISDAAVLAAIDNLPRHFFLDSALAEIAYEDRAFPIGDGQTISQPYTVAYQTQLLNIKPNDKVLEIGTGSMYQAMILAELGAKVFTIERQKNLFEKNKKFILRKKYPSIKYFFGDGFEGLPTYAPFDKIIITAAAPFIPPKLIQQLKIDGIMVLPVNDNNQTKMMRMHKQINNKLLEETFDNFSFVPMLFGKNG